MFNHAHTYSREQLRAVLGPPSAAVNSRNANDNSAWLLMSRSNETVLYEEPLPGSMYWLLWRCHGMVEKLDVCWAVGTPSDDVWQLVRVCSIHAAQFRGSQSPTAIMSRVNRRSWLEEYWKALEALEGIKRQSEDMATYETYQVTLEHVDQTSLEGDERVAFAIRADYQCQAQYRVVYSIENCTPKHAANNIIRMLLPAAVLKISIIGMLEPILVYPPSDKGITIELGTTSSGEAIMLDREDITRVSSIDGAVSPHGST